jgi:hypothetical protein
VVSNLGRRFCNGGLQRSPATTEARGGAVAGVSKLGLCSARHDGEQQKTMQLEQSSSPRGFNGRGEAAARCRDGELFFFKLGGSGGLLRWAFVQGKGWGSNRRLQWFSLSGRRCLSGFKTVRQRRGARCSGSRWGKSFARMPSRSFYWAMSPSTSRTMS